MAGGGHVPEFQYILGEFRVDFNIFVLAGGGGGHVPVFQYILAEFRADFNIFVLAGGGGARAPCAPPLLDPPLLGQEVQWGPE